MALDRSENAKLPKATQSRSGPAQRIGHLRGGCGLPPGRRGIRHPGRAGKLETQRAAEANHAESSAHPEHRAVRVEQRNQGPGVVDLGRFDDQRLILARRSCHRFSLVGGLAPAVFALRSLN